MRRFSVFLLPVLLPLFFCGIYRHDVPKEKYMQLAQQPQFDCVGQVFFENVARGSCILIDSRHVLSAAHVFTHTADAAPEHFYVAFGGKRSNIASISIHPAYKPDDHDIVVLELQDDVTDIVPATINTSFDELHSDIVGVGWGVSQPSLPVDAEMARGDKLAGENVIDTLCGPIINGMPSELGCDFDSPDGSYNVMGSNIPKPLEYICNGGDSGGGMFRYRYGKWQLVGICSHSHAVAGISNGHYGSSMYYTRVSVLADWIRLATSR
jgi:Trypsin